MKLKKVLSLTLALVMSLTLAVPAFAVEGDAADSSVTDPTDSSVTDPDETPVAPEDTAPQTVTVTFDCNGGSSVSSQTVTVGQSYGTLPTPTRTGYSFDGWYTSSTGGSKVTSSTTVTAASDHTLYANWTANQTSGSGQSTPVPMSVNEASSMLGLTFSPREVNAGVIYQYDSSSNKCTMTVTNNGSQPVAVAFQHGTGVLATNRSSNALLVEAGGTRNFNYYIDNKKVTSGTDTLGVLVIVNPKEEGRWVTPFYYESWTSGARYDVDDVFTVSYDIRSQSEQPREMTVYFESTGGSYVSNKSVTTGQTYGSLPTPTREGYTFDGWYTSKTGGSKVTRSTTVPNTGGRYLYLYAHWTEVKPVQVTVSFNSNGGSSISSKTVILGEKYGSLFTPIREGYTFDGWYTSKTGGRKVTSSTTVSSESNHTLYAHWTEGAPVQVTVSFNSNGGSSVSSKTVTVGEEYGSLSTPTWEGYTFDGWYTSSTGGSKVTSTTTVSSESNHTLYAHWTKGIPGVKTANPTNDKLNVNGVAAVPTVYKIGGSNYFKLRDVAALLNGTGKQFSVGYSGGKVTVTSGQPYELTGKELKGAPSSAKDATRSNDTILINGTEASLTVYKIGGSNYFKLRDLGKALDFYVGYSGGKVTIDTSKSYS